MYTLSEYTKLNRDNCSRYLKRLREYGSVKPSYDSKVITYSVIDKQ